jgi:branched-subunit amino acid transport protein
MTPWLIVLGMGFATYGIRLSVLVFVHHTALPEAVRDVLRYVTPAVLTAIAVTAVLYVGEDREFRPGPENERILAALAAIGTAWATKNVWATITAGMTALWLLQWAT